MSLALAGAGGGLVPGAAQGQERAHVVLVYGELPPDPQRLVRQAVEAQLADLPVDLTVSAENRPAGSLQKQIAWARELGRELEARGVFFLDAPEASRWRLFLVDVSGDRLHVRGVEVAQGSEVAAAEATAVIVRGASAVLLSDQPAPVPMRAVDPDDVEGALQAPAEPAAQPLQEPAEDEPSPPPPVAPAPGSGSSAPPPASRDRPEPASPAAHPGAVRSPWLRVAVAYAGNDFSAQGGWQHGANATLTWLLPFGAYAGAGFTLHGPTRVGFDEPPASFRVRRHPMEVFGGYLHHLGPWQLSAELGVVADLLLRDASTSAEPALVRSADNSRVVWGLSPRLGAGVRALEWLAPFAQLGLSYYINNFEYTALVDGSDVALLSPRALRLHVRVGVAALF